MWAGGFIGGHLVKKLKNEGFWIRGVDLKHNEYNRSAADEFIIGDLTDPRIVMRVLDLPFDEVYQLAADMEAPDTFLPVKMMQTLCITLQVLI